jgi:drug/metabolite transporter (DMT)-like permease
MNNDILSALYGLASAASWGTGDFLGGLAAKKATAYSVVIGSQAIGMILLIALAFIFNEPFPQAWQVGLGAIAGILGAIGLVTLYRALSLGRMGIAAPVSAVLSAIVPVAAGSFIDGVPGLLQFIGFGLAIVSVWFLARSEDSVFRWREIGLPMISGLGFGLFLAVMGHVSDTAIFWPLVAARTASITLLGIIVLVMRGKHIPARETLPMVALSGIFDAGGNALFGLAAQAGRMDVAGVLSSLYPASTVFLAWLVLKERITRIQAFGILLALVAIILITAS